MVNTQRAIRKKFQFSHIALNKEVWEDIHSISPGENLPVWKTLLLDADSVFPEIGPAIILTFTALEVFISKTLDDIARTSEINNDLWDWDFAKKPKQVKQIRYNAIRSLIIWIRYKINEFVVRMFYLKSSTF